MDKNECNVCGNYNHWMNDSCSHCENEKELFDVKQQLKDANAVIKKIRTSNHYHDCTLSIHVDKCTCIAKMAEKYKNKYELA